MESRLEFREVTHHRAGRPVLEEVNFAVQPGECFTILGPSGSGKTSLLRLCNRLDEPTSGDILLDGKPLTDLDPLAVRRRVTLVFQTPTMLAGSVADNIRYGPGLSGDQCDPGGLLDRVGLAPGLLEREASQLSVGQQQRVELARALANDPEILLLDEPTSGLDVAAAGRILDLVERLRRDTGVTILFVTHLLEQAERLADRVGLLVAARLQRIEDKHSFFATDRRKLEELFVEE